MLFLLYTLHVIICTFLILVILLQQGSGADLSVFGGGGTQTAFGARGATQVIHKLTVWGFVGFIVLTFGIALYQGSHRSSSVMSDVETASDSSDPAAASATEVPAADVPTDTAPAEAVPADATSDAPMEAATTEAAPVGDAGSETEGSGDDTPLEATTPDP